VTPEDAVIGEIFYVFAHEMGHATFGLFEVPMLTKLQHEIARKVIGRVFLVSELAP
jgi:hypothetical protein